MVFLFSGYHIQNCRSSEKIGRKEIILRFFFFPRDLTRKRKPWGKKSLLNPDRVWIFLGYGILYQIWLTVFFFPDKNPEEKKKRKIVRHGGRKEDICDNQKKKTIPLCYKRNLLKN